MDTILKTEYIYLYMVSHFLWSVCNKGQLKNSKLSHDTFSSDGAVKLYTQIALMNMKRRCMESLRFIIWPLTNLCFDWLIQAMTTSYTREYLPTSPSKQLMDWTILTDPKKRHTIQWECQNSNTPPDFPSMPQPIRWAVTWPATIFPPHPLPPPPPPPPHPKKKKINK